MGCTRQVVPCCGNGVATIGPACLIRTTAASESGWCAQLEAVAAATWPSPSRNSPRCPPSLVTGHLFTVPRSGLPPPPPMAGLACCHACRWSGHVRQHRPAGRGRRRPRPSLDTSPNLPLPAGLSQLSNYLELARPETTNRELATPSLHLAQWWSQPGPRAQTRLL